jgi:hypothetical protein
MIALLLNILLGFKLHGFVQRRPVEMGSHAPALIYDSVVQSPILTATKTTR